MKLFFDESGQTGCIIPNKKGLLFDNKQRYFVLGGILCKNTDDEAMMRQHYFSFLRKHGIKGELKGSDMMTRENNAILNDFIDTMLDNEHFYICCYDKIFYLATLINSYFFPRQLMFDDPLAKSASCSAFSRSCLFTSSNILSCNI